VLPYLAGWTPAQVGVTIAFAFWCLPQVFFYGLYTVLGQVLNARGSFGPYMWAPVVNNVVAIIGMIVFVAIYGSGDHPAQWWDARGRRRARRDDHLGVVAQALILVPSCAGAASVAAAARLPRRRPPVGGQGRRVDVRRAARGPARARARVPGRQPRRGAVG
jgi:peptidoglycan biosynthesis protein MviN/MurJ (putative lipid II flippase)